MNSAPQRALRILVCGIVLAVITVGGALLRVYRLDQPLWTDELHTAWVASGPLSEVAWRAEMGNQSPLYYYAEWLVGRVFGVSEVSMRLMSVAAGVALVPMACWLVLRWTGRAWAGLLAAALAAIDVDFLFYAQEARPYACVQVLAALHVAVFWRLLNRPTAAWRAAWIVGSALLFYLHYTAALILVAEIVAYGILWRVPRLSPAYRPLSVAIDGAIALLLMLPALGHLAAIFARRGNWESIVTTQWLMSMKRMAGIYVLLPSSLVFAAAIGRRLISQPTERTAEPQVAVHSVALVEPERVRAWALVACWTIVPVAIAWLTTFSRVAGLFLLRYVIGSAPGAIVMAGICCSLFRSKAARAAAMLVVLAAALYANPVARDLFHQQPIRSERDDGWRSAVAHINESSDKLPVLIAAGLIEADELLQTHEEQFRQYCLFPVSSIYLLERDTGDIAPLPLTNPGLLNESQRQLVVDHAGAWVLLRAPAKDVDQAKADLLNSLSASGMSAKIAESPRFGNVTVLRVDVSLELLAADRALQ